MGLVKFGYNRSGKKHVLNSSSFLEEVEENVAGVAHSVTHKRSFNTVQNSEDITKSPEYQAPSSARATVSTDTSSSISIYNVERTGSGSVYSRLFGKLFPDVYYGLSYYAKPPSSDPNCSSFLLVWGGNESINIKADKDGITQFNGNGTQENTSFHYDLGGGFYRFGGIVKLSKEDFKYTTNYILGSHDFNNSSYWQNKDLTITKATYGTPDSTSGQSFQLSGDGNITQELDFTLFGTSRYIVSFYAKAGSGNLIFLEVDGKSVAYNIFTRVATSQDISDVGIIQEDENGWYRCYAIIETESPTFSVKITPDTSGDIYLSYAQVEADDSSSGPGRYAATTNSPNTREPRVDFIFGYPNTTTNFTDYKFAAPQISVLTEEEVNEASEDPVTFFKDKKPYEPTFLHKTNLPFEINDYRGIRVQNEATNIFPNSSTFNTSWSKESNNVFIKEDDVSDLDLTTFSVNNYASRDLDNTQTGPVSGNVYEVYSNDTPGDGRFVELDKGVSFTQNKVQTFSIFVKKKYVNARFQLKINDIDGSTDTFARFDINQEIVYSSSNCLDAGVIPYKNDWYKCYITFEFTSSEAEKCFINLISNVYDTVDIPVSEDVGMYFLKPSVADGETITNDNYFKSSSRLPVADPAGESNSFIITNNSTNNYNNVTIKKTFTDSLDLSKNKIFSIFSKAGTANILRLAYVQTTSDGGTSVNEAYFDLISGQSFIPNTPNRTIIAGTDYYGNGWYRCYIVSSTGSGTIFSSNSYIELSPIVNFNRPHTSQLGNPYIHIWGDQFEDANEDQIRPSDYISTTGSGTSLTTSDENIFLNNASNYINTETQTIFVEFEGVPDSSGNKTFFSLSNSATTTPFLELYKDSGGTFNIFIVNILSGTPYIYRKDTLDSIEGEKVSIALSYDDSTNKISVALNGTIVVNDEDLNVEFNGTTLFDTIKIGQDFNNNKYDGYIRAFALIRRKLTNDELKDLTLGNPIKQVKPFTFKYVFGLYPTGAFSGYSFKRINPSYAGPLVKVRRSTDNQTKDIYHSKGWIDEGSLQEFTQNTADLYIDTWYDQSGIIENNYLPNSNDFTNTTYWGNTFSNTIDYPFDDPLSGQDAYKLAETEDYQLYQSIQNSDLPTNEVVTFSIYVKNISGPRIGISVPNFNNISGFYFNFDTNTFTINESDFIDYGYQDAGNGWIRLYLTYNIGDRDLYESQTFNTSVLLVLSDLFPSSPVSFYLYGAQLNKGSSAITYTETTNAGIDLDNHIVNTDITKQPLLWSSSTGLVKYNGRPACYFDGVDDSLDGSFVNSIGQDKESSFFLLSSPASTSDSTIVSMVDSNPAARTGSVRNIVINNGKIALKTDVTEFAGVEDAQQDIGFLFSSFIQNDRAEVFKDNVYAGQTLNSNKSAVGNISIGKDIETNSGYYNGYVQEFFVYEDSVLEDRRGIEEHLNEYYSVFISFDKLLSSLTTNEEVSFARSLFLTNKFAKGVICTCSQGTTNVLHSYFI